MNSSLAGSLAGVLAGSLAGGGVDTPEDILPSTLLEWWDARQGITLVSGDIQDWVGTQGLLTVSAIAAGQRPDFEIDGGLFMGRPVMQAASATGKFLTTGTLGADIVDPGSRPYLLLVGRLRVAYTIAGGVRLVSVVAGGSQTFDIEPGTVNGTARMDGNGGGTSGDIAVGTTPHVWECYYDADGKDAFAVDGVEATVGLTAGTAGANTSVNFCAINPLGVFVDDGNIAAVVLATALPSAAQRTALRAWALSEWGVP